MPLSVAAAVGEDEEDEEMERGNIQASMMSLEQVIPSPFSTGRRA